MLLGQQPASDTAWYASGTFWSIVAVVIAVVAIAVGAWAAFRSANPKCTLHVTIDQVVPLVASAPDLEGHQITVDLDGHQLSAPHVITIDIVSRSGKDITPDMFSNAPLELQFGAPIVALLRQYSDAGRSAVRDPAVAPIGESLYIGPALLTREHRLRYTVLIDGHPNFRPVADLANVTILRTPEPISTLRRVPLAVALTLFLALFVSEIITGVKIVKFPLFLIATPPLAAMVLIDMYLSELSRMKRKNRVLQIRI